MKGEKVKGYRKINLAMSIVGNIEIFKLKCASKDVVKSQGKTLRAILNYAKDTEYGREHNFAKILEAKSDKELFEAYRNNVKMNDYEDLRPYINKHLQGGKDILFPGKPKMYATTSGTTKEPKWIPITNEYFSNVYGKINKLWLWTLIQQSKYTFAGGVVSIVGKAIEGEAPDGTIVGSVSGVSYTQCPAFVKKAYTAPNEVFEISDYKARYYCIMRLGIERNTTLIVTANPSTIVEMQNNVNEFYDDYCNDIEHGTLKADLNIAPGPRAAIEAMLKPNPKRAAELRALKEKYGTVLPKHYWPDFQVLNTWRSGNTKVYLDKFKDSFPEHSKHPEFGYFASECRVGLVMNGKDDTTLFPHMHYFEFTREEDLDNENPEYLTIDQLELGKRYCLYVTTWAGLYRYNMNDLVEVTGFYGKIPNIQFIQKVNGIVTLTGEKLHERQFIAAVHEAEQKLNMPTKFFIGFADAEYSGYHFYYEFENQATTQAEAEKFSSEVDAALKQINIEYAAKRNSFRVKDPITHRLVSEAFEKFKARCIAEGARDGQFKLMLLLNDEKRHAKFKDLVIE
ncbi:MAG: GH3 auxin-responsive promoter family protein [Bacteroidales bacterium]|nr:GH3 auxin-responsive promoter family protein [Bacteroidales bacterium]